MIATTNRKRIWIDLDNSPHVPFFAPIINELKNFSVDILITVRKCFQVCELAEAFGLDCIQIGRHYGKNKMRKVLGLLFRSAQLAPIAKKFNPDVAISHGSRSQLLVSSIFGIPNILFADYEYVKWPPLISPTAMLVPEVLYHKLKKNNRIELWPYPGIKEDVYVPGFKPDGKILQDLGVPEGSLVVTLRPPASEAHYHDEKSDRLFEETVNFLGTRRDICMVILPRSHRQSALIKKNWSDWIAARRIIIPEFVVNGLNLIWHSDLVISGGGTMNREAAALGVPAYSIFAGKIGAVDRHLSETGRLVFLRSIEDIRNRIKLSRRDRTQRSDGYNRKTLESIVKTITGFLQNSRFERAVQEKENA